LPAEKQTEKPCPECGEPSFNCGRHFKVPKKTDRKQWEKVKFLYEKGFRFQHIQDEVGNCIPYPKTLEEAKKFVLQFRNSKYKLYWDVF
jgi:hypothetical protein